MVPTPRSPRCPAPRRSAPSTTPTPAPCTTIPSTPCPRPEDPIMTRKAEPQDSLAPVRTLLERLNLTTAAKAIGHAACSHALSVYYAPTADVLESLHAARADGTYRTVFRRVTTADLLLLDDAGFSDLGRDAANELFRVVCARYRQRSTLVVSNLPFKHWAEFLPSPAQAVAIADRLVDDATILRFSGKPYRQPRDVHGAPLDNE